MNQTAGSAKKRVLILGGGHAGFRAAKRLLGLRKVSDNLEIVIASSETSEVYHGLMPQIVGGKVQARNVLVPLRNFLPGIVFYNYDVESIDLEARQVTLDPKAERHKIILPYDYLVIALGSVTDLSRFPGLQEHGLQTKTIGDVYYLHDHLLEMLEKASTEENQLERKRLLTVVIVGAGYAGIEIGAEANNLLRTALRFYPNIRVEELSVSIISSTDRILNSMHKSLADSASRHLMKKGVHIRLSTSVLSASAGEVILSTGERIATRTVIVTAGIAPNPVVQDLPLQRERGRIKTDEFCGVAGYPGVYAIGDIAAVPHFKTGQACPTTFLYAFTQGMQAAGNIIADVRGKNPKQYRFSNFGDVAQLGNTFGLIQFFGIPFSGFAASLLVRLVFFLVVPSWRCRLGLLADWTSALTMPPDVSQMKISRTDLIVRLRFAAGQEIIRQGEPGSRFYIVNSGNVEVVRTNGDQEERLAVLGPGKYFGEVALLQSSMRTATVRALEDTVVLSIERKDFTVLVESLPVLAEAMSETVRRSIAVATGEVS